MGYRVASRLSEACPAGQRRLGRDVGTSLMRATQGHVISPFLYIHVASYQSYQVQSLAARHEDRISIRKLGGRGIIFLQAAFVVLILSSQMQMLACCSVRRKKTSSIKLGLRNARYAGMAGMNINAEGRVCSLLPPPLSSLFASRP